MKILHVGISEHLGGIETYLYKMASNVDLKEYQFDFLTYHDVTPCFYEEISALGCNFQRVTSRRKNWLQFRKDFAKLIEKEQYDIIHCHLNTLSFIDPIKIGLKKGVKVVGHSHNGSFKGSKKSQLLHTVNSLRFPAKKVKMLAVSGLAGRWMFGKKSSYTVLNNGVDLKKFYYTDGRRERIRNEFHIEKEKLIVHTGAFREQKNHDFLIDVFYELNKLEPTAKLMLVGDGALKTKIEEKVKALGLEERVIFAGIRKDIADVLCAGDVFVFPSFYEGFPCSLIEAEATGLYCFAADTITQEVKIDGLCEYISLQASAKEWAERIHLHNEEIARAACAQKIREANLDAESDVKSLCDVYRQVMGE